MDATVTPIRIGLALARDYAGFTQVELAEKVGVRQATISDIETGKTRSIDLDLLERICKALKVDDPGSLFSYEPSKRGKR